MNNSKRIGKVIGDYKVIDKIVKNKRSCYLIRCEICGNEKYTYNITEKYMKHGLTQCKKVMCKKYIGIEVGDYKIINAYLKRRLFVDARCNICGVVKRNIAFKDFRNNKNNHSKHCTILNTDKYDKKIVRKLLRTYQNCKTRIRLGNEGHEKQKSWKGLEFGFSDSVDFVEYTYNLIKDKDIDKMTIDRIDNYKGYVKGNIRFITIEEQQRNKKIHQDKELSCINSVETIERV